MARNFKTCTVELTHDERDLIVRALVMLAEMAADQSGGPVTKFALALTVQQLSAVCHLLAPDSIKPTQGADDGRID